MNGFAAALVGTVALGVGTVEATDEEDITDLIEIGEQASEELPPALAAGITRVFEAGNYEDVCTVLEEDAEDPRRRPAQRRGMELTSAVLGELARTDAWSEVPCIFDVDEALDEQAIELEVVDAAVDAAIEDMATATTPAEPPQPITSEVHSRYTVQPGDTLIVIAALLDVPLAGLLAANGLTESGELEPGQQLVIP